MPETLWGHSENFGAFPKVTEGINRLPLKTELKIKVSPLMVRLPNRTKSIRGSKYIADLTQGRCESSIQSVIPLSVVKDNNVSKTGQELGKHYLAHCHRVHSLSDCRRKF
jgi:hypothetical protein